MDRTSPEHRLIQALGRESGRNKKQEILMRFKKSSKLRNIFLYAFDPHRKYFIKKFPAGVRGEGLRVIDQSTWKLLDQMVARKITGGEAKTQLFRHIKFLLPSEGELLKQIVLKKVRVGVADGILNTVWPGLIPERFIMKAEDYETDLFVPGSYMSLKLDGLRADYKDGIFTSSGGYPITGLEHIAAALDAKNPYGYWDGELIVPELYHDFDLLSGYLRSGASAKPMARFVVFDTPLVAELPLSSRLDICREAFPRYRHGLGMRNPAATYLPHIPVDTEQELMDKFGDMIRVGHEGIMVKHPRSRYRAGRSINWLKLKGMEDAEFEIVDYYEGEGRLAGTLGGVILQTAANTTTRVGGGFSDEQRAKYWAAPDQILGRLATTKFMSQNKNGSLRHPIFKCVRWDI